MLLASTCSVFGFCFGLVGFLQVTVVAGTCLKNGVQTGKWFPEMLARNVWHTLGQKLHHLNFSSMPRSLQQSIWPNYNDVIDVIRNYRTDLISGSLKYRSHRTDLNSGSWGPEVPWNWKMPLKSKIGHVRRPKIENRPCSIFQNRKSAMFDW